MSTHASTLKESRKNKGDEVQHRHVCPQAYPVCGHGLAEAQCPAPSAV